MSDGVNLPNRAQDSLDRFAFADGYDAEARRYQGLRAGQILSLYAERASVRTFSQPRLPAIPDRIVTPDCAIAHERSRMRRITVG